MSSDVSGMRPQIGIIRDMDALELFVEESTDLRRDLIV